MEDYSKIKAADWLNSDYSGLHKSNQLYKDDKLGVMQVFADESAANQAERDKMDCFKSGSLSFFNRIHFYNKSENIC